MLEWFVKQSYSAPKNAATRSRRWRVYEVLRELGPSDSDIARLEDDEVIGYGLKDA